MRRAILLILSAALGHRAISQVTLSADVETLYDDNVNNNYLQTASPVTAFHLQAGHVWDADSGSVLLSYDGAMNYFSAVTAKTFHAHEAGLSYAVPLGEEDQTLLDASASYMLRVNREEYTSYDHGQFSLHGTVKHHFSDGILGCVGYMFRSVRFAELQEFDYLEHYAFVQLTSLLPTNSTLILEADLGSKGYTTPNMIPAGETGHRGRRQLDQVADAPSVTQLVGIARIGHPVTEGTGLSLTLRYQGNIQKESRYLVFPDGTLSDDEILDDHYGYEGPLGTVMLTQLFPSNTRAKVSFSLQGRTYANRPAYNLAGVQVADSRQDTRRSFTVQLSKSFDALGCTLRLLYDHIINKSNDPYYDYTNNAVSLMLSVGD